MMDSIYTFLTSHTKQTDNPTIFPTISSKVNSRVLAGLFRINDWTKNLLVFAPAFFAQIMNYSNIGSLLMGFFAFCLLSSAGYMFNDYLDVAYDVHHPEKNKRPYAAGHISFKMLVIVAALTAIVAFALAFAVSVTFVYYCLLYFSLSVAYSTLLKKIPYVDIVFIVCGFVIRVYAGSAIVNVTVSGWLLLLLIMATFLLALGKRRNEILLFTNKGIETRRVIRHYNLLLVNVLIFSGVIASIITYFLYTIDPSIIIQFGTNHLKYTAIPVTVGLIRYLFLLYKTEKASNPANMLISDPALFAIFVSWIGMFAIFIYG